MWIDLIILLVAGTAGGFVGGLVGVGGGLIFAPVLFFYFEGIGVSAELITPLTIGTSLLCTLIVSLVSAYKHYQQGTVDRFTAFFVGLASAVAVMLMTAYVTTQPWYNAAVFQIVFSILLLAIAVQMSVQKDNKAESNSDGGSLKTPDERKAARTSFVPERRGPAALVVTGAGAGAVASAAGVGGGIVLVPLYRKLMGLPIHWAVGTSSATIILVSLAGVIGYVVNGPDQQISAFTLGYVDYGRALVLSVPAAFMARTGVRVAHTLDQAKLKKSFAFIAIVVAIRMSLRGLGVF